MTGSRRRSRKKWSRQKGIRRGKGLILVLVLIVLAVIFTALTILQFNHMAHARKSGKKVLYDWLEAHGVA